MAIFKQFTQKGIEIDRPPLVRSKSVNVYTHIAYTDPSMIIVDQTLVQAAKKAHDNAYAPYSKFHVGAAVVTNTGNITSGSNVENASYGLTICAERNCISQSISRGEYKFCTLVIYTEQESLIPPCGACRQFLAEFFDENVVIVAINHKGEQQEWTITDLLPDSFTPQHLDR